MRKKNLIPFYILTVLVSLTLVLWHCYPYILINRIKNLDDVDTLEEAISYFGIPHTKNHYSWYYSWTFNRLSYNFSKGLHWNEINIWRRIEQMDKDLVYLRSKSINQYQKNLF